MGTRITRIIIAILILVTLWTLYTSNERYSKLQATNYRLRLERLIDNGYSPSNKDMQELDINKDGKIDSKDIEELKESK